MHTIFNNGLTDDQNEELNTTEDSQRAVHLVWDGLSNLVAQKLQESTPPSRRPGSKTKPQG
jgi:YD repeat-containing protein